MRDVAAEADHRNVPLEKVGIKDFHLPLNIKRKDGSYSSVLSVVEIAVELPKHHRGTHMSRFVEILRRWQNQPMAEAEMKQMSVEAAEIFSAQKVYLETRFKYFLEKRTPATNILCTLDYDCTFSCRWNQGFDFILGVQVPTMLVCPCSKEISDFGAHSQRAVVSAQVRYDEGTIVWIEDLVPPLEKSGSAEIFPLLKREDEKLITEQSFSNPKFVEDAVRDCFLGLRQFPNIAWFQVSCEAAESIHNHYAYASTSWRRPPRKPARPPLSRPSSQARTDQKTRRPAD
jgi:GTP cyclohydrolase I